MPYNKKQIERNKMNISFKQEVKVFLDKKHIGAIKEIKNNQFQYTPKGSKQKGQVYSTLDACKNSLSSESV